MTVPYRFSFVGLGVIAATLSACASPVAEMTDDPSHPASPSAPTAPALTFSHSLEAAGGGPEPGAEMSAGPDTASRPGSRMMDHGQHGAAAQ